LTKQLSQEEIQGSRIAESSNKEASSIDALEIKLSYKEASLRQGDTNRDELVRQLKVRDANWSVVGNGTKMNSKKLKPTNE
jgi:uncharacterized LabA/DUF88 family protein